MPPLSGNTGQPSSESTSTRFQSSFGSTFVILCRLCLHVVLLWLTPTLYPSSDIIRNDEPDWFAVLVWQMWVMSRTVSASIFSVLLLHTSASKASPLLVRESIACVATPNCHNDTEMLLTISVYWRCNSMHLPTYMLKIKRATLCLCLRCS